MLVRGSLRVLLGIMVHFDFAFMVRITVRAMENLRLDWGVVDIAHLILRVGICAESLRGVLAPELCW